MYTIKRFEKGDVLIETKIRAGTIKQVASRRLYVVMDQDGQIATTINPLTGKLEREIYHQKGTAQQQADYLNRVSVVVNGRVYRITGSALPDGDSSIKEILASLGVADYVNALAPRQRTKKVQLFIYLDGTVTIADTRVLAKAARMGKENELAR